jgi:excisionase family DNA binding protein
VANSDLDQSFLTVAEVAEILKLNQQTVRNWIDQGSLPALRIGRRVRIRQSDFDRVLAEGLTNAGIAGGDGGGPNAEDFWGGEPVGRAEPDLTNAEPATVSATNAEPATAGAIDPDGDGR